MKIIYKQWNDDTQYFEQKEVTIDANHEVIAAAKFKIKYVKNQKDWEDNFIIVAVDNIPPKSWFAWMK